MARIIVAVASGVTDSGTVYLVAGEPNSTGYTNAYVRCNSLANAEAVRDALDSADGA